MQPSSAERLKFIREKTGGISQQKLADALQVPVSRIKDVESGKNNITIELGLKLEEFSNFDFKWILTGEGDPYLITGDGPDGCAQVMEPEGTYAGTTNVIELDHGDVIKQFSDKTYARDLNKCLVELERLDPVAYREVGGIIKGVVLGLHRQGRKESHPPTDRRRAERRIETRPDLVPEGQDRRSGKDRRQGAGVKK